MDVSWTIDCSLGGTNFFDKTSFNELAQIEVQSFDVNGQEATVEKIKGTVGMVADDIYNLTATR